jgi:Domain of unknown function (DUF397)
MKRGLIMGEQLSKNPDWAKSSLSFANGNCIEVAEFPDGDIGLRDDKMNSKAPVMRFSREEWDSFTEQMRSNGRKAAAFIIGESVTFSFPTRSTLAQVPSEDGRVIWAKSDERDVLHTFSAVNHNSLGEVGAFALSAMRGEFDFDRADVRQPQSV